MNEKFRNELLALETETPSLKQRYEKELCEMMEKPLHPWQKISWMLSMGMGIVFGIGFGIAAIVFASDLPIYSTIGFVAGSLVGFAWAFNAFRIVRKQSISMPNRQFAVGIMWMFVVLIMTINLMVGMQMEDTARGTQMILYAFVFLFIGALFMIQHFIEKSEQTTKEHLLKLELQLAELNEKLSNETKTP